MRSQKTSRTTSSAGNHATGMQNVCNPSARDERHTRPMFPHVLTTQHGDPSARLHLNKQILQIAGYAKKASLRKPIKSLCKTAQVYKTIWKDRLA